MGAGRGLLSVAVVTGVEVFQLVMGFSAPLRDAALMALLTVESRLFRLPNGSPYTCFTLLIN